MRKSGKHEVIDDESTPAGPDDLITVRETARRLHVVTNTIYNWIDQGRLGKEDGLVHAYGRTLFHWPTLWARVMAGKLNGKRDDK